MQILTEMLFTLDYEQFTEKRICRYVEDTNPEYLETQNDVLQSFTYGTMLLDLAEADTQVFDTIRHLRNLAVIRCPQFFGMFERERQFLFLEGRAYPKTYVPNVIMVCADVETARIINIEKVDEGKFC